MSAAETWDYGATQATARFAEMVESAVNGADYLRDQLGGQLPELARLLAAVRDAQSMLQMLERETEQNLAESVKACGEREPEVPGVGVLRLNRRRKQEWDSPLLFASLVNLTAERARVPDDARAEFEQAALDILGACLPLTKSLGWRSTGLKECGIDPDSFRATTPGSYSVRIVEPGS